MEQCRRGGCGFRCEHIQSHMDLCTHTHTQSASENEREVCRQMGAFVDTGDREQTRAPSDHFTATNLHRVQGRALKTGSN